MSEYITNRDYDRKSLTTKNVRLGQPCHRVQHVKKADNISMMYAMNSNTDYNVMHCQRVSCVIFISDGGIGITYADDLRR